MTTIYIDFAAEQKRIGQCVSDVLTISGCRRATAYLSETRVVKATAQQRTSKRAKRVTVLVTVGKPNFVERRFIRLCKKDGVCFPMESIYHKHWPKKK